MGTGARGPCNFINTPTSYMHDGVTSGAPFLESDTVRQAALASLPQRPAITAAVLDKAMEKVGLIVLWSPGKSF